MILGRIDVLNDGYSVVTERFARRNRAPGGRSKKPDEEVKSEDASRVTDKKGPVVKERIPGRELIKRQEERGNERNDSSDWP